MAALIKKNLVFKENKLPARYSLTEEGRRCIFRVLNGGEDQTPYYEQSEKMTTKEPKEKSSSRIDEVISIESEDDEIVTIDDEKPISQYKNSDEDLPDIGLAYSETQKTKPLISDLTNKNLIKTNMKKSNKIEELSLSQRLEVALVDTGSVLTNGSSKRDEFQGPVLFTLPPGSFEVLLFVDNCEQSHA